MKREQYTLQLIEEHNLKGTIVEVGVLRGAFSSHLLKANPQKLVLIDCWEAQPKEVFKDYTDYSQEKWDEIRNSVIKKFSKYNNVEIIQAKSLDAVDFFEDNSIDLVYLDGNHSYESIKADLNAWGKKVKNGGILSGHDFTLPDVRKAVEEYTNRILYYTTTNEKLTASYYIIKQ